MSDRLPWNWNKACSSTCLHCHSPHLVSIFLKICSTNISLYLTCFSFVFSHKLFPSIIHSFCLLYCCSNMQHLVEIVSWISMSIISLKCILLAFVHRKLLYRLVFNLTLHSFGDWYYQFSSEPSFYFMGPTLVKQGIITQKGIFAWFCNLNW